MCAVMAQCTGDTLRLAAAAAAPGPRRLPGLGLPALPPCCACACWPTWESKERANESHGEAGRLGGSPLEPRPQSPKKEKSWTGHLFGSTRPARVVRSRAPCAGAPTLESNLGLGA